MPMHIFDVVPLTSIPRPSPQILTYYYPSPLALFSLVEISLGNKATPGIIVAIGNVKDAKLAVRSANFQIKEINRVLVPAPVVFAWQYELARWIADYYWSSLGFVLKKFIPRMVLAAKVPDYQLSSGSAASRILLVFPDNSFFQKVALPEHFIRVSSELSPKKELQLYKEAASGKDITIVGTKKSLFLPFSGLKEIHIYEEAESSHKSWEQRPKYHAVLAAKKLAALHRAQTTYHSTLPSLAMYLAKKEYVKLPSRLDTKVIIIDLSKEKPKKPFAPFVEQMLARAYEQGKKVLLYVNRRGEGRLLLCRDCGFVPKCPNCDLALTFHLTQRGMRSRRLLCHHCGYEEAAPNVCSACGSHELRSYGFGTERVAHELTTLFPKANVLRLDSDNAPSERAKRFIIDAFLHNGNFLVATSMIFQVPLYPVPLVLALNPDSELNIPDFAQSERTFLNLWKLRQWSQDTLLVQSYNPQSPVLTFLASGDWRGFYDQEAVVRKALNYPPFSFIIKLTYQGKHEDKVRQEAEILAKKLTQAIANQHIAERVTLLGPAPAFLPKLKGNWRYNMLLKISGNPTSIKRYLLSFVPPFFEVDVDPIDSL